MIRLKNAPKPKFPETDEETLKWLPYFPPEYHLPIVRARARALARRRARFDNPFNDPAQLLMEGFSWSADGGEEAVDWSILHVKMSQKLQ